MTSSHAEREAEAARFRTFGFVVLRRFFEPGPLAEEIDHALDVGLVASVDPSAGGEIRFRYAPMMTAETPVSLSLLDRTEAVARALLGGPTLPTRAKGVRYSGDTPWHADSTSPVASVGFAAYLEPLDADTGALRVLPGSHRPEMSDALRAFGAAGRAAAELPAHVIVTDPGDVIAFDEHLFHASSGGGTRRQWRVDHALDAPGPEAEERLRAYFAAIYPAGWDGGYDVRRFPSYGADFRASGRPAAARLAALGVYDLAAAQECGSRGNDKRP